MAASGFSAGTSPGATLAWAAHLRRPPPPTTSGVFQGGGSACRTVLLAHRPARCESGSGYLTGYSFARRGHLATSGDGFGFHDSGGGGAAAGIWRREAGPLLKLCAQGSAPRARNRVRVEGAHPEPRPRLRDRSSHYIQLQPTRRKKPQRRAHSLPQDTF